MRSQLFIYGSCVARDIVRITQGRYGLVHYAARQSWISAANKSLPRPRADNLSPFSARSLRGDFSSNLPYLLRAEGSKADVILIDLASDRHGVYRVDGGYVSNTGELRRSGEMQRLNPGRLIEFSSSEHRRLFRLAAHKIKRILVAAGLFDKVLVLNAPFAGKSDNGDEVPLARGLTAEQVNERYSYYYGVLEKLGFSMVASPPEHLVVAGSEHTWGLEQDHYIDDLYYWWADQIDEFIRSARR